MGQYIDLSIGGRHNYMIDFLGINRGVRGNDFEGNRHDELSSDESGILSTDYRVNTTLHIKVILSDLIQFTI